MRLHQRTSINILKMYSEEGEFNKSGTKNICMQEAWAQSIPPHGLQNTARRTP